MILPLLLRIDARPDGSWGVTAAREAVMGASGVLAADDVAALREGAGRALDPESGPVLVIPGEDTELRQVEEAAGRALARVFTASRAVEREAALTQGQARGAEQLFVPVVESESAEVLALPWELLAEAPEGVPLEAQANAFVARLGPGGRSRLPDASLRPVLWAPDPDDPDVAELTASIHATCAKVGLPAPQPAEQAALAAHEAPLLFVVVHGQADDDQLSLLLPDGPIAPGGLAHALQPLLSRCPLVVLLVCDGGHAPMRSIDGLVPRLLQAGARAVVASSVRLAVPAAQELVAGLLDGLSREQPLAQAMREGRRRVGELHDPSPEARWWRLTLTASSLPALSWCAGPGLPPGWQPDVDAADLLYRALRLAQHHRHDWLGLEHLALAAKPSALPDLVAGALAVHRRDLEGLVAHWVGGGTRPPRPTRRLARVVAALPSGFSIASLAESALAQLPAVMQMQLGLDATTRTLQDGLIRMLADPTLDDSVSSPPADDQRWNAFQVLGGPDDGRVITVRAGDVIGRAHPGSEASLRLFEGTASTDRRVSRHHLEVLADGAVRLLAPTYGLLGIQRRDNAQPNPALGVVAGSIIRLTAAVALIAVIGPSSTDGADGTGPG